MDGRDKQVSEVAIFNGTVLAYSDDIVIVEGSTYFPRASVATDFFPEVNPHGLYVEGYSPLLGRGGWRLGDQ